MKIDEIETSLDRLKDSLRTASRPQRPPQAGKFWIPEIRGIMKSLEIREIDEIAASWDRVEIS